MSPRLRLLIPAIVISLLLGAAGCPDERAKRETLTCKDGTFTSGTRARQICNEQHGGVRGE